MILYLVPFESVNGFVLHSNIQDYLIDFEFTYFNNKDSNGLESYTLEDEGVSLDVENNKIVNISCEMECLYKGRNMIGMSIEEFINYYEIKPVGEVDTLYVSDDEKQDVYEFEDIGLQVWCNQDNKIVTVIASNDSED